MDAAPRPPATDAEIAHLVRRLRLEVGLTNALGAGVLVLGAILFDPPAREDAGPAAAAAWSAIFGAPAIVAGVWISNRLVRPLTEWLRHGRGGDPAPPDVQIRLLAHPGLQALVLLVTWLTTALGLAIADVVAGGEEPIREFVTTLAGVSLAGVIVSTLSFLAAQRVLGPWYERFFAGADPTGTAVPSTRVRRRLVVVFLLGTTVPLFLVAGVVSERLANPDGVGQLEEIVWFLAGVGSAAGLALMFSVRESITRPLELIRGAAERVRAGDLSAHVPVESADEFGEVAVAFNAMVEGLRERRRIQDLFGRQVGDAVAAKVLEEGVSFTGTRREASVLMLDLANFTRLAEDAPPERVVAVLNHVFAVVIHEVDVRHGLVNKFMGDAVLAVFGAPLDDPDHARHAVDAARAIAAGLEAQGVEFGIGVSTGNVVAAHVGAAERFEYTVVGDAVNEAARLQELTREHDTNVLVSGRTRAALGETAPMRHVGQMRLRGRATETEAYTPLS